MSELRSRVVAFHGGYLSPGALRRDMGDPGWVDNYVEVSYPQAVANILTTPEPLALVGYSIGGSLIGHLSHMLPNIRAAVLYESALIGLDRPAGDFPVLWIRNRYKSTPRREREFEHTRQAWKKGRTFYEPYRGEGKHIYWRCGWPPFGHAWDRSLNPFIEQWLRDHGNV